MDDKAKYPRGPFSAVTDLIATVARGRDGYAGFRSWYGETPDVPGDVEPQHIAAMVGYPPKLGRLPFVELPPSDAISVTAFFAADGMYWLRGARPSSDDARIIQEGVAAMGPAAHFYSNGLWHDFVRAAGAGGFGWHGISEATFDGGLIGFNDRVAFIVWVEEED